ncbi:unnamed protein product [Discosporangium mesarthrocarpum]
MAVGPCASFVCCVVVRERVRVITWGQGSGFCGVDDRSFKMSHLLQCAMCMRLSGFLFSPPTSHNRKTLLCSTIGALFHCTCIMLPCIALCSVKCVL